MAEYNFFWLCNYSICTMQIVCEGEVVKVYNYDFNFKPEFRIEYCINHYQIVIPS